MYADELAGGALYRGLAEYADDDQRATRSSSSPRPRSATPSTGRACCARRASSRKRPRVPFRVRALRCARARLRHRGGAADHAAHRGGRVRPLPRRGRGHRRRWRSRRPRPVAPSRRCRASPPVAASRARKAATAPGVGGALRATVFGVNDGLVSNFSLVMGVAGGTSTTVDRAARRDRRARRRRVLDGVGRVDLGPLAARALRERAAHRAGGARGVPRGGARGARADLPGEGRVAPDAARALVADDHGAGRRRARHARPRGARARPEQARLTVGRGGLVVPRVRVRARSLPLVPFFFGSGTAADRRRRGAVGAARCSRSAPRRRSSPGATPAVRAADGRSSAPSSRPSRSSSAPPSAPTSDARLTFWHGNRRHGSRRQNGQSSSR